MGDPSKPWSLVPCSCSSQPSSCFSSSSPSHFSPENPCLHGKFYSWKMLGPGTGAARSPWHRPFMPRLLCSLVPGARHGGEQRVPRSLRLLPAFPYSMAACARPTSCPSHCALFRPVTYGTGYVFIIIFVQSFPFFLFSPNIIPYNSSPLPCKGLSSLCLQEPVQSLSNTILPSPFLGGRPSLARSLPSLPDCCKSLLQSLFSSRKPKAEGRGRQEQLCFSYRQVPDFLHSSSSLLQLPAQGSTLRSSDGDLEHDQNLLLLAISPDTLCLHWTPLFPSLHLLFTSLHGDFLGRESSSWHRQHGHRELGPNCSKYPGIETAGEK